LKLNPLSYINHIAKNKNKIACKYCHIEFNIYVLDKIGTINIITVINNNNHLFILILFKKVYLNNKNNITAIIIEIKYPITIDSIIYIASK